VDFTKSKREMTINRLKGGEEGGTQVAQQVTRLEKEELLDFAWSQGKRTGAKGLKGGSRGKK